MNLNDDIIQNILTSENNDSSILLNWHLEDIADKKGNNYATKISRIRVLYRHQKEENAVKEKVFFIKVPSNSPVYKLFEYMGVYKKEVVMYTEILPKMYQIDEEDYFAPRQYYFDDEMSLVLEDLSQYGYKCVNRLEKFDIEHCIYALKCLAKFHAFSFKLETTVGLPELVKTISRGFQKVDFIETVIAQQIPSFIDSIPQKLKDQYPNMIATFKNLSSASIVEVYNSSDTFNVLIHGDFNFNNIMFRYDKYDIVQKVKIVDFQMALWGSPAIDLIFFTITSMKFDVYLQCFPFLLEIYTNTLNKILGKLNCPIYDMRRLINDINKAYPYALFVLSCSLPGVICDPEEPLDLQNACKTEKLQLNGMAQVFKQKFYREVSVKWFEQFAKYGTLYIDEENSITPDQ